MSEDSNKIEFGQKRAGDGYWPCPKCGGYPLVERIDGGRTIRVKCPNGCHGGVCFQYCDGITEREGAERWNRYLKEYFVEMKHDGDTAKNRQKYDTSFYIESVCENLKAMLLEKNRKYGDSAINPIRVFSNASSIEQIKVRMDDKLNRIRNQQDDEDEDVWRDLAGYMVLLLVAREIKKEKGEEQE